MRIDMKKIYGTPSKDGTVKQHCDRCLKYGNVRYFHGSNEDTFDFFLCKDCLVLFFNSWLHISLRMP